MEEIVNIILKSFERGYLDNDSKSRIKEKGVSLKQDDINYLVTNSFKLFKQFYSPVNYLQLVDCLESINNSLNTLRYKPSAVSGIYFSSVDDCTQQIINFINSAKESLYICVFTISDNRLSQHILNQHRKGVKISLLTDNEKQFDKGSDVFDLAAAGIRVKVDVSEHHMHHKFAISDHKSILTGSYNWTKSAADFNEENFIVLDDNEVVKTYSQEFERLWAKAVYVNKI